MFSEGEKKTITRFLENKKHSDGKLLYVFSDVIFDETSNFIIYSINVLTPIEDFIIIPIVLIDNSNDIVIDTFNMLGILFDENKISLSVDEIYVNGVLSDDSIRLPQWFISECEENFNLKPTTVITINSICNRNSIELKVFLTFIETYVDVIDDSTIDMMCYFDCNKILINDVEYSNLPHPLSEKISDYISQLRRDTYSSIIFDTLLKYYSFPTYDLNIYFNIRIDNFLNNRIADYYYDTTKSVLDNRICDFLMGDN